MANVNPARVNYPMASIYVWDLHPDVTEAMLFEKFSTAGPLLSIRVCRDTITRRSLGYAYVNFQQPADAERALDSLSFDTFKGRPIRLMWSQRNPSLMKSGFGNVFIKNLDKSIDNKVMYDTFSAFGNILSCKIVCDEHGSRGYGFVHFETEEAARSAIEKVNGMLLNGKKVIVGRFMNRREVLGDKRRRFNNVYVKIFSEDIDDEKLREIFEPYGIIICTKVMLDDGVGKGKDFEDLEDQEAAERTMRDGDIEKLVFSSPTFQSDFQRTANTSADVLRQLLRKRIITPYEKKELFGLSPQKRNRRISEIILGKRCFSLQPLIEAMSTVPENEALLKVLRQKIERKKAHLNNPETSEKKGTELKQLQDRIMTELLPVAVGDVKAKHLQSEQRNCPQDGKVVDESLTCVIGRLKDKAGCLNDLCEKKFETGKKKVKAIYELKIKRMQSDHARTIAEYEKKLEEKANELEAMRKEKEEIANSIDERMKERLMSVLQTLQGKTGTKMRHVSSESSIAEERREEDEEEEEVDEEEKGEGKLKHAGSYTSIINIYVNENNSTGDIVLNQQNMP